MNLKDVRNSITKNASKKFGTRKLESITDIAIHHSGTIVGDSASFARFHVQNNGWAGIGYHYVVLLDGTIEYCGDINTVRANVFTFYSSSIKGHKGTSRTSSTHQFTFYSSSIKGIPES